MRANYCRSDADRRISQHRQGLRAGYILKIPTAACRCASAGDGLHFWPRCLLRCAARDCLRMIVTLIQPLCTILFMAHTALSAASVDIEFGDRNRKEDDAVTAYRGAGGRAWRAQRRRALNLELPPNGQRASGPCPKRLQSLFCTKKHDTTLPEKQSYGLGNKGDLKTCRGPTR